MVVNILNEGDAKVVVIDGRLDTVTAPELERTIAPLLAENPRLWFSSVKVWNMSAARDCVLFFHLINRLFLTAVSLCFAIFRKMCVLSLILQAFPEY